MVKVISYTLTWSCTTIREVKPDMPTETPPSVTPSQASETPAATQDDFFLIGELEPLVGLEPKTIRFYERAGLANPKRHGRIRTYRMSDVQRLKAIKYLRQFGVSIAKIREILKVQGELSMESLATPSVQSLLNEQLHNMRQKYEALNAQIDELSSVIDPNQEA